MDRPLSAPPHAPRMPLAPLPDAPAADGMRRITSTELLGAQGQIVITHDGREYRLRITQNRKLILTA